MSYDIDDLCRENDIDPTVVISWLVEEELIDLSEYFNDEEDSE